MYRCAKKSFVLPCIINHFSVVGKRTYLSKNNLAAELGHIT